MCELNQTKPNRTEPKYFGSVRFGSKIRFGLVWFGLVRFGSHIFIDFIILTKSYYILQFSPNFTAFYNFSLHFTEYKFTTRKIKHNKSTIHNQQLQIQSLQVKNKITKVLIQSHQVNNKIREATISSTTHIIYMKIPYSKQNKIREAFNFNTQATISSATHITYIKIQTFKVSQSTQ